MPPKPANQKGFQEGRASYVNRDPPPRIPVKGCKSPGKNAPQHDLNVEDHYFRNQKGKEKKQLAKSQSSTPDEIQQKLYNELKLEIEDEDPQKILAQLNRSSTLEEFFAIFTEHLGKKRGGMLAEKFFKQMGKDKIVLPPIENFYQELANYEVPPEKIQSIRQSVASGWKYNVEVDLLSELGPNIGKKLFAKYGGFIDEKPRKPYEDAKFVADVEGLKMFKYPQSCISEMQKSNARTIIVFGETGCGKSTFLNALVNFLQSIQINDYFRYQIIVENPTTQMKSVTKEISTYYVKDIRSGNVYRLVDTPGFGDTDGFKNDQQLVKKVEKLFREEIKMIHGVLFVLKSSSNRVTAFQSYIFQSVMDLFGKNLAKNFNFILTFSDSGKPLVLESIKDQQMGFGKYWHQLLEPKYLEVNNCGIFQKIDPKDQIKAGYWKIGMKCIENLFLKIDTIDGVGLGLTKRMISAKEQLSIKIKNAKEMIEGCIAKQSNIKSHIEKIAFHSNQIDESKDFMFQVDQIEYYDQQMNFNVTRCNNCMNTNCHEKCIYGDGQDKKRCYAMDDDGNCTICPKKCSYVAHSNDHKARRQRTIQVKQTNSALLVRFDISTNEKHKSEKILEQMFKDLDETVIQTAKAAEQMVKLHMELSEISLTDRKQESTIEYLQFLVLNQKKEKKHGYQNRIDNYNQVIRQYVIIEKYAKKGGLQDEQNKLLAEMRCQRNKNLIKDNATPGMVDRLLSFLTLK